MADQAQKRIPDHNYVHCLRCHKPQDKILVHLTRVCMKDHTPEEIAAEVKEAKSSFKQWIWNSRTWNYQDLKQIITHQPSRSAMVKKLIERGFFISNMPRGADVLPEPYYTSAATASTATAPAATASAASASTVSTSAAATPPASSPATSTSVKSDATSSCDQDDRTGDPSWKKDLATTTTSVRIKMKEGGLYEKFREDAVLLVDFKKYLTETLGVTNCQQEVDNVSRFLRYLQPTGNEPTMDFLSKSQETRNYISSLQRTDMSAATIINYLKNMMRFVSYLKIRLDLAIADQDLRTKLQAFWEFLQTMKKAISKVHSRDVCKTKYNRMVEGIRSVRDCQEILRVAKADILRIFGKLIESTAVSESEKTTFRYFCEAVMVLKHFQRPGAVEGMTTTEWVNRKPGRGRVIIGISQHKTATMQVAALALTQEEEAWFQAYYEHIRPDYISGDCDKFFISSSGKQIHSVTNDVARLHESYHIKPATSQEVRRAVETEAALLFGETQKDNVSHYLAHSTSVAQQHYRMQVDDTIISTAILLDTLGSISPPNQSQDSDQTHAEPANQPTGSDFSDFVRKFPMTRDGQPPSKKARVHTGFPEDHVYNDKWRASQYAERQQYLLSHFNARKPAVGKVQRVIDREGWTDNCPKAEDIVKQWTPAPKFTIETDPGIIKCVTRQNWKGLVIKDFQADKGLGVVAAEPFSKGDIVCDYHGKLITAAEGRTKMQDPNIQPTYLFFFKSGQKDLCIDAETFPCMCHPQRETFGRRINHSRKHANLRPLHCELMVDGEDKDVILFKATKHIAVDEELLFDYGVNRKSFRGEGLELEWLES